MNMEAKTAIKPRCYYWKLIGECYIHGIMNGEAITLQVKASNERKRQSNNEGSTVEDNGLPDLKAKAKGGGKGKAKERKDENKPVRETYEGERMYYIKTFEVR